jgi:PEP-CTERM motif-containing protein
MRSRKNSYRHFCVVIVVLFTFFASAQAGLINLTLEPHPDVASGFIDVTYDAASDAFVASGFAMEMNDDSIAPTEAISSGLFSIGADIDDSGLLNSGTVNIGGTIANLGFNSGTLLTGSLTAVGADAPSGVIEFLFSVTGGDAVGLYGGIGATGGIIMGFTDFTGWGSSFNNNFGIQGLGQAVADTAPVVPEPTTLALLTAGMFAIKRRKRS